MTPSATHLNREEYYKEFTLRNAGFISEEEQAILRRSVILIAGCGSTGGSVIELLIRSGAEKLILVDNGRYDLNNANRQNMVFDDVDRFKPVVFQERCKAINPYADIEICNIGITPDNVHDYVSRADIVIDAVDVTGRSGLEMKFLLHEVSHKYQKTVICGYDMAATQYIPIFDYRDPELPLFGNQITSDMVATMDPLKVCTFLVPISEIPEAMFEELERHTQGKDYTSQLGIAANLFGTITSALVVDILAGKSVKKEYTIDVWKIIRGEYENIESLAQYRQAIENWQKEPCQIQDDDFIERSIKHYTTPLLPNLLPENSITPFQLLNQSESLISISIKQADLGDHYARQLMRYAFVHYARVGFINKKIAAMSLMHHEPISNLHEGDVHILVLDKTLGKLMGYSTLKAMPNSSLMFSDSKRDQYCVEGAFGRDTFANIEGLEGLRVSQVREIGRVVKSEIQDKTISARVGVMLLDAYHRVITKEENKIQAMIGDGEEKVTLANLISFGFNPTILPKRTPSIEGHHLFSSRYSGRKVKPFWFSTDNINEKQVNAAKALLELSNKDFYPAYRSLKNNVQSNLLNIEMEKEY